MNSNLAKRLLSALVLLPPAIWTFIEGGWWLRGLAFAVALVCFWEYGEVTSRNDWRSRIALLIVGGGSTALALLLHDAVASLLVLYISLILLAATFVLKPGDMHTAWPRLAVLYFGVVYIGIGLWSVSRLRDFGDPLQGVARGGPLLAAFTATWANDTCAYFAGRAFGKHKMAEAVSPKKTWEGFAGGLVGTLVFLLVGRLLFPNLFAAITWIDAICIGIPASFFGPIGDLAESMWKRGYEVKDSGAIIPGHGGMLDRIDAVFFVVPWTLFYLSVLKPFIDNAL
jgi:phosphatidate cytidylyltransferase